MVKVGVGADDAPQTEAVRLDHGGQPGAIQLGIAGVDQDDVPVIYLVDRQQGRVGLRRPGISQNMAQLHSAHILSIRQYTSFSRLPQERMYKILIFLYANREKCGKIQSDIYINIKICQVIRENIHGRTEI